MVEKCKKREECEMIGNKKLETLEGMLCEYKLELKWVEKELRLKNFCLREDQDMISIEFE